MGLLNDVMEHPEEFMPLLKLKMAANRAKKLPKDKALAFCYEILNNVSRSFAIVIQQLPDELRDAVCIFYLVLRALDTIEDDMSIPQAEKLPQLLNFYEKNTDRGYTSVASPPLHLRVAQLCTTLCLAYLPSSLPKTRGSQVHSGKTCYVGSSPGKTGGAGICSGKTGGAGICSGKTGGAGICSGKTGGAGICSDKTGGAGICSGKAGCAGICSGSTCGA
ncbi:squalene synthetase-like protein [Cymbomonas tetramitiformis]|uniref:Squalene synthetase-like protein n=1 Tax=Cymbomonas tetramitiformis TaxID=36881 RepID=A0AAE0C6P1_9CHLO|nr:squalene synthetase-like protein [Cymbomonas tetramitiformis]